MGSGLLLAAAAAAAAAAVPPAKHPSILSTTTTTTTTSTADGTTTTTQTASTAGGTTAITTTTTTTTKTTSAADGTTTTTPATTSAVATTISSLGQDQLREIFLRLPNLPALVRAALTCRSWLRAVRSSRPFRRLFRALHPAPFIGIFLETDGISIPAFIPVRRSDPDVAVALHRGDFFLTSLPAEDDASPRWNVADCRHGHVLLWDMIDEGLAVLNPITWTVDSLPMPADDDVKAETRVDFAFIGFHLLSSDENPLSFRVACICKDGSKVRAAIFSPGTWDWVIHPWAELEIGGDSSLKFKAGSVVDGSIYWPCHGQRCIVRINTATMDITTMDLPAQVKVDGYNFKAAETKDGALCIVYASDDFVLHVWIDGMDGDGIQTWIPHKTISLRPEMRRVTRGLLGDLKVVQVRDGYAYLSTTSMSHVGLLCCWFFSLSLETMKLDLLIQGRYDGRGYPYFMAWPPSLVGDGGPQLESSY
ncbi:uncharacterized protein LOC119291944 [Triticum dicoccoides]|uniref:uncharacterized protein LOC119291944 n=1 Tax=Triticum dicoccoides TaxID=85692 RepID=UPI00188E378F|nr:uncharacterized protein LOC119291944 [Triticum dicoccoides]